ncbi:MAG TPA: thioredoxin-like domain-containing protein [bacterium]
MEAGGPPAQEGLSSVLRHNLSQDVPAAEFPAGADWINTAEPLTMAGLRGKVVLLDFWTFCCINCIHVIEELRRLEAAFPDTLVVVGVHSAKFENESRTSQVRQSVLRYEIAHPVVNDARLVLWNTYGVRAWPTLVLIAPDGRVALEASGEHNEPLLHSAIAWLIEDAEARGALDRRPLAAIRPDTASTGPLRFPGKVLTDGERLYIADTTHHQIVIADLDGRERLRIGRGAEGARDGSASEAEFSRPQGLALDDRVLYVADTGNHLIRAVEVESGAVRTIAGTGRQGNALRGSAPASGTALNSPWDVLMLNGTLYLAMAGAHQLWSLDPARGVLAREAGSGLEALIDGPAESCALAQPSGLAADAEGLIYIADSEASAIRMFDPKTRRLTTLIGRGLFEFGDRDGPWTEAMLQHPLGIAWNSGNLYVADSYNHKIKRMDLAARTIETVAGTGAPGDPLAEPGGLSATGSHLYIADTNTHGIRRLDLVTGELIVVPVTETDE